MNVDLLMIAGSLSLLAAGLHVGIIFVGPSWYRLFSVEKSMALMAKSDL
jgi:putative oxidoreductase